MKFDEAIWLLYCNLVHFSKKSGRLSSACPEILTFISHCSANFQPILDCFVLNFKLKYEDLENIKADRVNTVVINLGRIPFETFQEEEYWVSRCLI